MTKIFTSLIVDDERLARVALGKELSKFTDFEIVGEASSIKTAVPVIKKLNPDIIFLDIQLSDGTGFDLLNQVDYNGKVIFVTAYSDFATRAFEINAQDYLLKPVSKERVNSVLNRLKEKNKNSGFVQEKVFNYDDRIMVEQKKSIHFLKLNTLVLFRAERGYTSIFDWTGKEYLVLESLGRWQKKLPADHFARVHRNSIINFNFIEKAEKSGNSAYIFLKGVPVPVIVSRGYYKLLKAEYFYR
ncbi:MAG TPA: LytTR family DNA-binding domain-containing protein [Bacteroidales bacterium]|nr:LytTR family DNA-binding domain-containing protein [Bacteroidales bacterium]